jgi:transposase-like protein
MIDTIVSFKSILDLLKAFPNEQTCINHLEKLRWNGNVISPFEASSKVYKCKNNRYKCTATNTYFNVRTNTIFEDTKLPLQKWFMALYIFSSHKKGISSHQLAKDLDITQKSAWFVLHRLRYAFEHPTFKKTVGDSGPTQVDETFIGGKESNKHKSRFAQAVKREAKKITPVSNQGRSTETKTAVVGLVNAGVVIAKVVPNTKSNVLQKFVRDYVKAGSIVVSDEWKGYVTLRKDYTHEPINHSMGQYVREGFHTNSIEGFWSQLKRGVYGIYHHVSPEHLQAYVDEFTLRYNTRTFTAQNRFDLVLGNVAGKRLTYETLINKA